VNFDKRRSSSTDKIKIGKRIAIIGPMASGKSALAVKLGRNLQLPVYHLDQLRFFSGTFWQPKPEEEFQELHGEILSQDLWIMEGNYRESLPSRLSRATDVIWLNPPIWRCIVNFYKRFFRKNRQHNSYPGKLQNAQEKFTIGQLKYIFIHKFHRKNFELLIEKYFCGQLIHLTDFNDIQIFSQGINPTENISKQSKRIELS
jgi:adenylate kinase family enzyme